MIAIKKIFFFEFFKKEGEITVEWRERERERERGREREREGSSLVEILGKRKRRRMREREARSLLGESGQSWHLSTKARTFFSLFPPLKPKEKKKMQMELIHVRPMPSVNRSEVLFAALACFAFKLKSASLRQCPDPKGEQDFCVVRILPPEGYFALDPEVRADPMLRFKAGLGLDAVFINCSMPYCVGEDRHWAKGCAREFSKRRMRFSRMTSAGDFASYFGVKVAVIRDGSPVTPVFRLPEDKKFLPISSEEGGVELERNVSAYFKSKKS
jgi:hypothetical protein